VSAADAWAMRWDKRQRSYVIPHQRKSLGPQLLLHLFKPRIQIRLGIVVRHQVLAVASDQACSQSVHLRGAVCLALICDDDRVRMRARNERDKLSEAIVVLLCWSIAHEAHDCAVASNHPLFHNVIALIFGTLRWVACKSVASFALFALPTHHL
jgi:hypothetical protein